MILVSCFMLGANIIKAIGMMIKKMVMVFTRAKMALHTLDHGRMT